MNVNCLVWKFSIIIPTHLSTKSIIMKGNRERERGKDNDKGNGKNRSVAIHECRRECGGRREVDRGGTKVRRERWQVGKRSEISTQRSLSTEW